MKGIKRIIGVACLVGLVLSEQAHAQSGYADDALRFSQFQSTGSARILGIGGAQTSLGGDVSNIHMNLRALGFLGGLNFPLRREQALGTRKPPFFSSPKRSAEGFSMYLI
ncbi:hypothetical protein [Nitritalea halalkaliphila]|uniref:hypothetical protein n=1 Tax=Nitritalea halalkaliphila TaxID=590849 RepID=UPI001EE64DD2|nr:hypothetical protein [Nitritalea halalkaliphila]